MANITTAWTQVASKQTTVGSMTITFYIEARVTSQDTANNRTTREIRFRSVVNSGSGSGSDYEFTCTGCTSKSGSAVWYFGDETILSGSGTITHNSDGTKSETLTATADCYIFPSKITLSGTATYPTIARQSSVSISPTSLTIGSTAGTIAINSASSGFTHKIEILTGGTVRETFTGISNSKTWTPSAATYNRLIPNAKSITATIRCTTYSGSTQIGTQTTTTCTLNVNTSTYAPTTNPTATGSTTPILNGKTNVTIAGSVTIPTNSFATASAASIKVGNTTTALTLSSGNYSYTINKTTVSSAVVTVTDSRGVSSSKTVSWNLVPYVPLTVGGSVSRPDAVGNSIVLTVGGNYYTGSDYANTLTVKATYNTGGGNQTVTITPTVSGTKYSGSVTLTGFDYTQTYSITVTATDKQGTVTATVTVPVSAPVWSAGNKGGVNHFDVHGDLRVVAQNDPSKGVDVYHNGTNFWLGARQKISEHFLGGMYLSTGYDGTKGNETIKVAVPNDTNTNADIYSMWHEGNAPIRAYFSEVDWSTGSHSADNAPDGLVWCRALNVTNLPVSTGFGWLMTIGNNLQLFALHSATGVVGIYYRGYHSSTWDAWNLLASMDVEAVDYNALTNKPKINSVTLTGNQTSADLKLQDPIEDLTDSEIDNIIFGS